MTKIFNFALKLKGGGREGGRCEVLRPCHPPPKFGTCTNNIKGLTNKIYTAVKRNLEEFLQLKTFLKMSIEFKCRCPKV